MNEQWKNYSVSALFRWTLLREEKHNSKEQPIRQDKSLMVIVSNIWHHKKDSDYKKSTWRVISGEDKALRAIAMRQEFIPLLGIDLPCKCWLTFSLWCIFFSCFLNRHRKAQLFINSSLNLSLFEERVHWNLRSYLFNNGYL